MNNRMNVFFGGGNRSGKSMTQAILFLENCRKGVKVLTFGPGYVAMPRKIYDELMDKQVKYSVIVDNNLNKEAHDG